MVKRLCSGNHALLYYLTVLSLLMSIDLGDILSFVQNKSDHSSRNESALDGATLSFEVEKPGNNSLTSDLRIRRKRNVMQMARMLKCISGCNPLSYRGYGCYCGYKGSGQPVDDIDRCCLQHDWCYTFISCPQSIIYFVPYTWQCMPPATAQCGVAYVPGVPQKCATQLCECDREFARCVSNYPCPQKKPECKANNYVMLQAIMNNNV